MNFAIWKPVSCEQPSETQLIAIAPFAVIDLIQKIVSYLLLENHYKQPRVTVVLFLCMLPFVL